MKALRVLVAVLALSVCTYAGNMDNGVTGTPPPAPSSATTTGTDSGGVAGHMEIPVASHDAVTEIALNLISGVLSLF